MTTGEGRADGRVGEQGLGLGQGGLREAESVLCIAQGVGRIDAAADEGALAVRRALGLGQLRLGLVDAGRGLGRVQCEQDVTGGHRGAEAEGKGGDGAGELGRQAGALGRANGGGNLEHDGSGSSATPA
jgi:hypothetical protein